jgi:hypothetical protein
MREYRFRPFRLALPTVGRFRWIRFSPGVTASRGDPRQATYNRRPFDIATLAIFPEYLEFEGQEVLRLVVEGAAGRTAT